MSSPTLLPYASCMGNCFVRSGVSVCPSDARACVWDFLSTPHPLPTYNVGLFYLTRPPAFLRSPVRCPRLSLELVAVLTLIPPLRRSPLLRRCRLRIFCLPRSCLCVWSFLFKPLPSPNVSAIVLQLRCCENAAPLAPRNQKPIKKLRQISGETFGGHQFGGYSQGIRRGFGGDSGGIRGAFGGIRV